MRCGPCGSEDGEEEIQTGVPYLPALIQSTLQHPPDKLDLCPLPQDQGKEGAACESCPPSPTSPLDCQAGPLQGLQAPYHPHHLPPGQARGARLQVGTYLSRGVGQGGMVLEC